MPDLHITPIVTNGRITDFIVNPLDDVRGEQPERHGETNPIPTACPAIRAAVDARGVGQDLSQPVHTGLARSRFNLLHANPIAPRGH